MADKKKRRSLAEAFGETTPRQEDPNRQTSEPVNPAREDSNERGEAIITSGEVEMVPGKGGRMAPADAPVNMTFTVTAKERYLWTLELKRRGRTAVSVLREAMEEMMGEEGRR